MFVDPGLFQLCAERTGDNSLYYAAEKYLWGYYFAYGAGGTPAGYTLFHTVAWADSSHSLEVALPSYKSVLLPNTGVAILRSGWERDDQYILLQFTDSKVHQELSFGAVYLYDHGPWLVGNGYHLSHETQASAPTNQHSTLSLDNLNQTNTGGNLLAFSDLGQTAIASVTSRSYPNLQHTRSVFWAKPWHEWLVVDNVEWLGKSDNHSLQLRWYVRGSYDYHKGGLWRFTREEDKNALSITMLPGMDAKYSEISRSYDWEKWVNDAVGVQMDVDVSRFPIRLVSILTSGETVRTANQATRIDSQFGTIIENQKNQTKWFWMLPFRGDKEVDLEGTSIQGQAGCLLREDSGVTAYCLFSGSTLKTGETVLINAGTEMSVEVDLEEGQIYIDSVEDTSLELYWPFPISSIVNQYNDPVRYTFSNNIISLAINAGKYALKVVR